MAARRLAGRAAVQIAARHADPRIAMRYDQVGPARTSTATPSYILAATWPLAPEEPAAQTPATSGIACSLNYGTSPQLRALAAHCLSPSY